MWKEHFKNLLGNSPCVTDKHIMKIININLDIKLGQFTQEDLTVKLIRLKSEKLLVSMKYPRPGNSLTYFFDTATPYITRTQLRDGQKAVSSTKGDLEIVKNYRHMTLTFKAAKVYNGLLLNYIEPEIEKILWKNQNGFRKNQSTTSQILTLLRIIKGVGAKNSMRHSCS